MPLALADLISVARGERPADLLLANARVVNVFSGEVETGNVAICGGRMENGTKAKATAGACLAGHAMNACDIMSNATNINIGASTARGINSTKKET